MRAAYHTCVGQTTMVIEILQGIFSAGEGSLAKQGGLNPLLNFPAQVKRGRPILSYFRTTGTKSAGATEKYHSVGPHI